MPIPVRQLVFSLLISAAFPALTARAADDKPYVPIVFSCDGNDLAAGKAKWQAGDATMKRIVGGIIKEADKSLEMKAVTVTDKTIDPPSGDKHDYVSLSPYWWPDPSKPDGKPYIRKDGEFNPERAKYDTDKLDAMSKSVEALGGAFYFTGDEKYAAKAKELIKVWFFDDATKMNPNVQFAQFRPGHKGPEASGVIEGNRLRAVVDADGLMATSKTWTADDSTLLKGWFGQFLKYLLESEQGKAEQKSANNHGTHYGVQVAIYAMYTGDNDLAKKLLTQYVQARIGKQIEPDGSQPLELLRTRAFDYSRFNILAHEDGAMLAERVGMDLWNYKSDNGRSLRMALDWLAPYATGEKQWEHQQISPSKLKEAASVYRRAANAYKDPKYEAIAAAIIKRQGSEGAASAMDLYFPSKLQATAAGR